MRTGRLGGCGLAATETETPKGLTRLPDAEAELRAALAPYERAKNVYWVQDEPANMGPWRYLLARYPRGLWGRYELDGITRLASASPASGSAASHRLEQERLLTAALGGPK